MSRVKEYPTDNDKWAAVVAREAAAQNAFVYCVITTKIFCRPTCKVRLARRANVVFRETAKEAQAAGFRACKRCRPDQLFYVEPEVRTVSEVCETLRALPDNAPMPALDELAAQAGLTKFHFHRLFKKVAGKTPREYVEQHRREKQGLASAADPSAEPSRDASREMSMPGVSGPEFAQIGDPLSDTQAENFTYDFLDLTTPPSLYHSDNSTPWSESTMESSILNLPIITYTYEETTFGLLLVAFNEAGNVAQLELGESREELLESLHRKRPPGSYLTSELPADVAKPDITALLEAIERPSGKVLNLDESVII